MPIAVANRIALFLARSFRVESEGKVHLHHPHQFALFDVGVGRDKFWRWHVTHAFLRNHPFEILVLAMFLLDGPMVLERPLALLRGVDGIVILRIAGPVFAPRDWRRRA